MTVRVSTVYVGGAGNPPVLSAPTKHRRTDGRCGSRPKIQVAIHPELLRQRQLQQLPRQLETWTDHGLGSHLLQCTA